MSPFGRAMSPFGQATFILLIGETPKNKRNVREQKFAFENKNIVFSEKQKKGYAAKAQVVNARHKNLYKMQRPSLFASPILHLGPIYINNPQPHFSHEMFEIR